MSSRVLFFKAKQFDLFDAPVQVKAGVRNGKAVAAYTRVQKIAPERPAAARGAMQIRHHNGMYFATVDGHNVGTASLHDDDPGRLVSIVVDPEHRRKGIARAMLAHIEAHTGVPLTSTSHRSPEGEALWASHRPPVVEPPPPDPLGPEAIAASLALAEVENNKHQARIGALLDQHPDGYTITVKKKVWTKFSVDDGNAFWTDGGKANLTSSGLLLQLGTSLIRSGALTEDEYYGRTEPPPPPRHVSDEEKAILARLAQAESQRVAARAAADQKHASGKEYDRARAANPNAPPPGWEKLIAFENARAGAPLEWGGGLDTDGNVLFPEGIRGTKTMVKLEWDHVAKLRGQIFTHGHPNGLSLSKGDWKCAAMMNVREFRAIGKEWVHSIKRGPNGWPSQKAMMKLYDQAANWVHSQPRPPGYDQRNSGEHVVHATNERAAAMSNGGVIYERTARR